MRLNRRRLAGLAALVVIVALVAIGLYVRRLNRLLTDTQKQQADAAKIEVTESRLRAPSTDGLTLYLDSSDVRATAALNGVRYLATSGGLVALDDGGGVKRRYTSFDGLPDNDLTSLAVFRDKLFIGTSSRGMVSFDGNSFSGYSFTKPKAIHVETLAVTETELLIGTLDGGLFEYDGQRFARRINSTTGADFVRVTALLPLDSRLYIGTQDSGLYIWREAQIEHLRQSDGLPSPHVTGLAALHGSLSSLGQVAVATDFGVVSLNDRSEIKPISNVPNITSLAISGGRLWAGLFSGGVIDLNSGSHGQMDVANRSESDSAETAGLPRSASTTVYASEGKLWALTRQGAFSREEGSSHPAFDSVARTLETDRILSEGHVSSLALDGAGQLWIGYFDAGIDTIAPETGERLSHIEDDRVREINFLRYDRVEDRVLAATSRGLVVFDKRLRETTFTRDQSGLINDSVAHVSLVDSPEQPGAAAGEAAPMRGSPRQAMVLATAGGLTELSGGRSRS
ncbi:MAG: ligand-binding sensor domain-containing protein, partial [Blastocatellia bacterium]